MDRSYRLKMENKLHSNIITKEYVLNCVAKYEKRISTLAYKEKQYRAVSYINYYKMDLEEMIEYRKPFIDILMRGYRMSLDDIKAALSNVKTKNIPSRAVCDEIRNIIINGEYVLE